MTAATDNPLRVLVLAPHAFYIDRGTPIDVDILVRALCEKGYRVDLACYHEGEPRDYPGLTIHRIDPGQGLDAIGPGFSGKKLRADRHLFALAMRLAHQNDYDVVHAGEEAVFIAMWIKARLGVPYVYDMDSSIAQQMVEKMGFLRPVAFGFNFMEARAIKGALACAPVCHALGDLASKRGARHYEVLHDISQIDPDAMTAGDRDLRAELGLDGPVFMYVGNFETYQGVGLLLEGFAEAHRRGTKASLVIAGGSDDHIAEYTARATALGLDGVAHFIGRWPVARLGELLAQADVLAAPRTRGVNTPQKIFPYMHSGRAVLLTRLPTHTQIVDDSVCMLADPTPDAFADAIHRLATDDGLRARLGAAGRAFVERDHVYPAHRDRVDRLYHHVEAQLNRRPNEDADDPETIHNGTPAETAR
ncbi:MAG: glycosyltransferase [Phycisphaerales bacterium JB040]